MSKLTCIIHKDMWRRCRNRLCLHTTNKRSRYNVTSFLIGLEHTQTYPWKCSFNSLPGGYMVTQAWNTSTSKTRNHSSHIFNTILLASYCLASPKHQQSWYETSSHIPRVNVTVVCESVFVYAVSRTRTRTRTNLFHLKNMEQCNTTSFI